MINYLKVYEDGTKEATKFKPLFGVKESDLVEKSTEPLGDIQVNNIWVEPSNTPAGELAKETTLNFFGDGSCIATYNLNGNANDLSGNYNGTATNVTYSDGKFGQAGVFNGSNSLLKLINDNVLNLNNFSVSFFAKGVSGTLLYIGNDGNLTEGFKIGTNNVYIHQKLANGMSFNSINQNKYKHIVLTIDTSGYKLYVDNVLEVNVSSNGSVSDGSLNPTGLQIGRTYGNTYGNDYFNGSIDQVRVFSRALTELEVQELYYTYSQNYTPYISQPTYLSQNGKLLEVEVNNGVPSTLQANEDAPKLVEECIQVSKVIQTGNRKVIELGTIFTNNRYVIDNPFGNENYEDCDVVGQLLINGSWNTMFGFAYNGVNNIYQCSAWLDKTEGIVVKTGQVIAPNGWQDSTSITSSALARVIVTYVGEAK